MSATIGLNNEQQTSLLHLVELELIAHDEGGVATHALSSNPTKYEQDIMAVFRQLTGYAWNSPRHRLDDRYSPRD